MNGCNLRFIHTFKFSTPPIIPRIQLLQSTFILFYKNIYFIKNDKILLHCPKLFSLQEKNFSLTREKNLPHWN